MSAPPPPPVPSSNNFQILAQFNMTAHQRGYTVTYPARSEGPHHTPTWHVQCCRELYHPDVIIVFPSFIALVNGEVRGEGVGKNQKQAKELAARQAWLAMGWGHRKQLHQMASNVTADPVIQYPSNATISLLVAIDTIPLVARFFFLNSPHTTILRSGLESASDFC